MLNPQENRNCYLSQTQREVLLQLLTEPTIEQHFFLTGGTALAVFYLAHRVSNDFDLFSRTPQNLADLDFWIKSVWPRESVMIKQSPHFLSCLIRETKVDFVIEPEIIPSLRVDFDDEDFFAFYQNLILWMYHQFRSSIPQVGPTI